MTKQAGHIALLGAGAIIVIVWLMRRGAGGPIAQAAEAQPSLAGPDNVYPNVGPIDIPQPSAKAAPFYIGYNSAPPLDLAGILKGISDAAAPTTPSTNGGGCGGCNGGCPNQPGQLVSTQKVSAPVLASSVSGLQSFATYAHMAVSSPTSPSGGVIAYKGGA